jgi:hypothetical protein
LSLQEHAELGPVGVAVISPGSQPGIELEP